MPEFIAKVGTSDGVVTERTFTADSEDALRSDLQGRDYLVFAVRRKSGLLEVLPGFGTKHGVRMKEFLLFNQELAALIRAGLPIIASLEILIERRKNQAFKKALMDVRDEVRGVPVAGGDVPGDLLGDAGLRRALGRDRQRPAALHRLPEDDDGTEAQGERRPDLPGDPVRPDDRAHR